MQLSTAHAYAPLPASFWGHVMSQPSSWHYADQLSHAYPSQHDVTRSAEDNVLKYYSEHARLAPRYISLQSEYARLPSDYTNPHSECARLPPDCTRQTVDYLSPTYSAFNTPYNVNNELKSTADVINDKSYLDTSTWMYASALQSESNSRTAHAQRDIGVRAAQRLASAVI